MHYFCKVCEESAECGLIDGLFGEARLFVEVDEARCCWCGV